MDSATPRAPRPASALPQAGRPALAGIRVVDFSRLFAGPLCTMMLGDLGADVIKVEPPSGDEARGFGPPFLGGEAMNFMAVNRNKRSLTLNLKHPDAREIAQRLCQEADVVVENFRPGVAEKLGVGYEQVAASNPRVIYCSISGFGTRGPYASRPALDLVLQGLGGVMDRQGWGGEPKHVVITIADCFAAALASQGILAALLARDRDGLGQRVTTTLFEGLLTAQAYRVISPAQHPPMLPAMADIAPYQAFRTRDGWFTLAVVTEKSWEALWRALERPDLAEDPRFRTNADRAQHLEALVEILTTIFKAMSTEEVLVLLDAAGVPCGPVKRVEDLFEDEHMLENEIIVELDHPAAGPLWTLGLPIHLEKNSASIRRPAPTLGQHNVEVLAELGCTRQDVERLAQAGAL